MLLSERTPCPNSVSQRIGMNLIFGETDRNLVVGQETCGVQVDDIENITVQIFAHLHSLADRIKRPDIEAATNPANEFRENFLNESHSRRFNPLRKETNFYEQEDSEQKIRTKHVVYNILFTLGNIFFGLEFFDSHQDSRTNEEISDSLKTDSQVWKDVLQKNYGDEFHKTMNHAFERASELLKSRQADARKAYYRRLTLYVMLTLSLVGKVMKQRVFTTLALTASLITLVFMLILYGKNSQRLKQARLAIDLKASVETAERNAAIYRLSADSPISAELVTTAN